MKLADVTKIVRSKNAGPFTVTIDILFDNRKYYEIVRDSHVLNAQLFADLYKVPIEKVQFFEFDAASAFKAAFPRRIPSGSPTDSDIYGSQQHALILDVEVPINE